MDLETKYRLSCRNNYCDRKTRQNINDETKQSTEDIQSTHNTWCVVVVSVVVVFVVVVLLLLFCLFFVCLFCLFVLCSFFQNLRDI